MLSEIQDYGIDCSDARLQGVLAETHNLTINTENVVKGKTAGLAGNGVSDHYTAVTFVLIWVIFFITVFLVILQCKRQCNEKKERVTRKNIELVSG